MAVQTLLLEHWAADIKFTLKRDLIIILKCSVVSWKKNVERFLKEILDEIKKKSCYDLATYYKTKMRTQF